MLPSERCCELIADSLLIAPVSDVVYFVLYISLTPALIISRAFSVSSPQLIPLAEKKTGELRISRTLITAPSRPLSQVRVRC